MSLADDIREDSGQSSRTWLFLAAAVLAAGAFLLVAISSFDQQIFYFTVAEAVASPADAAEKQFRLKGNVDPGSHMVREGTLDEHRFTLEEGGETMVVSFRGPLPDTFQDNAEVVALGQLDDSGVFVAEEVSAKCPSRYESTAPTANE